MLQQQEKTGGGIAERKRERGGANPALWLAAPACQSPPRDGSAAPPTDAQRQRSASADHDIRGTCGSSAAIGEKKEERKRETSPPQAASEGERPERERERERGGGGGEEEEAVE